MANKIYQIVVVILLLIIGGFLLFNQSCGQKTSKSTIDTIYVKSHDTKHTLTIKEPYPVPYKIEVPGTPGATITIPAIVDALKILIDYYTKRSYNDSIVNDSVSIYLKEEVFKNELKRLYVGYKWKAKTMVIKETKIQEKQLLFIGAEPYGNLNQFGMFASVDFDTKKALFGYGYDPFNKVHKISVKGKLRLWKKK